MISSHDVTSIVVPISFSKFVVGTISLNAADNAMRSTSSADEAISVCSLNFQMMGHPACFITNPVMDHADAGYSEFVAFKSLENLRLQTLPNLHQG